MDLNEIKKLLGKEGGKLVIIEDGKPTMVVYSYETYSDSGVEKEEVTYNEIPQQPQEEISNDELTIDDLPV